MCSYTSVSLRNIHVTVTQIQKQQISRQWQEMCFVLEKNDESVSAIDPWCRQNVNCVKVLKV